MTSDELRQALDGAIRADDGTSERRRRRLDISRQLVVALVDDLDDAAADKVIKSFDELTRHDPRLEIEVRRELAFDLASVRDQTRAVQQLSIALKRAQTNSLEEEELELGADLASLLRESRHDLEAEAVLANTAERVSARREHSTGVDRAEELVDANRLAEARELLERLPPADDDREARALLDNIRRRQGEQVQDPTETPDATDPQLDPRVRAFVIKPQSLAQGVFDGGLLGNDKIIELSNGAIENADDLDSQVVFGPVRSYRCACGRYRGPVYAGMVCRRCRVDVIAASYRRVRCGHIDLASRVVHPWYVAAAAMLLDKPLAEVQQATAGQLETALTEVDADALAAGLKRTIASATSSRLANVAGQRLALVEAFRRSREVHLVRPESIVLSTLLVLPPETGALGLDGATVRAAYRRVLEEDGANLASAVGELFDLFPRSRRA